MTLTLLKYIIIDKTIDVTFHQLMDNLILPDFKSSGHNVCQLTLNDVYGFMNEMFTNQLILQKKKYQNVIRC